MRIRKPESRRTARPFGSPGFTLVELLVVISIIVLLATMLMPTVQVAIRQFYAGRSAVIVRRLHDGALLYKEKTRFLPGEKKDTKVDLLGTDLDSDPRKAMKKGYLTGSQVLAACLFNIEYDKLAAPVDVDDIDASKVFAAFKPEYLTDHFGTKKNSISDGFPKDKAMAICYFLSRDKAWMDSNLPGEVDENPMLRLSQFRLTDNEAYIDSLIGDADEKQTVLEQWVDRRKQTVHHVINNGSFILLAPGGNRKYLGKYVNPDDPEQTKLEFDTDDLANDYGKKFE